MSAFHRYVIGVVTCLIVLAALRFAPAQADKPVKQWEYRTVPFRIAEFDKDLSALGNDAWELVAVIPGEPGTRLPLVVFKRPK